MTEWPTYNAMYAAEHTKPEFDLAKFKRVWKEAKKTMHIISKPDFEALFDLDLIFTTVLANAVKKLRKES